ncbi:MAG TPA: hypothetical protein VGE25_14550 [Sediminibacterium sp.]|jgi:hypothetical protein
MYYLTERSVMANDKSRVLAATADRLIAPFRQAVCVETEKEAVFTQVDLWNLQKHMKTIHVTDRFPRTWEGTW